MTSIFVTLRGYRPPVEYASVRPTIQALRAGAAGVVFAGCAIAGLLGVPEVTVPTVATALVLVHALIRRRRAGPFAESLIIDSVIIVGGLGWTPHADVAMVAAVAYLIAAALTFATPVTLVAALTSFGAALSARQQFIRIDQTSHASDPIVWMGTAALLLGVALALGSASRAVTMARGRLEAALTAEQRASEMKNEFVSMITHELRTPLTNIAGFALTMQESWAELDSSEMEEFLRIIVTETEHLGHLVEDVLTIPRLEAGRLLLDLTDFALQPAAYRIADLLFPAGGDRSASVSIGGSVRVHADPNRVEQVLRNLLENARKYGGDQVSVVATRRGDHWMIVVADNGPGVPAAHHERVFGVFEQVTAGDARSDTGFGLGLAVCRNLVEAMGGRIWYEPGFPVGARFCFTLPAAATSSTTFEAVA